MQNEIILYSDFDLNFMPHPLTGDLTPLQNDRAIAASLRHLCNMESYDIPFKEKWHSNIRAFLFANVGRIEAAAIETNLEWAIKKFEPRIKILKLSVDVNEEENGYDVTIVYQILSLMIEETNSFFIRRIR